MLALIFVCNVLRIKGFRRAPLRNLFSVIVFLHAGSPTRCLYVFERMIETIIGVLIALLVNRFFQPQAEKRPPEPPEGNMDCFSSLRRVQ